MERNIKTVYLRHHEQPKITRSTDANRAVGKAVEHMQINQYGSHVCEVYDDQTGELHAQVKRKVNGDLVIVYMRDPKKYETKYALSYVMGH